MEGLGDMKGMGGVEGLGDADEELVDCCKASWSVSPLNLFFLLITTP